MRPGALALRAEEDRELTLIALVGWALSRDHFAGDAVRPHRVGTFHARPHRGSAAGAIVH